MARRRTTTGLRKEEQNKLALIAVLIILAVLIAISYFIGKYSSFWVLLLIALIAQQCIAIPLFAQRYYRVYGYEFNKIASFIPWYNECKILLPWVAIVYLICWVLIILGFIAGFVIPYYAATTVHIFGSTVLLAMFKYGPYVFYISFAIASIVRGYGYLKISANINDEVSKFATGRTRDKHASTNIFMIFLTVCLCFPLLRTIGIAYELSLLTRLVKLNDYRANSTRRVQVYEEESE